MSKMKKKKTTTTEEQNKVTPIPEPNAYYERVLELREKNPKAFAVLSPAVKMALYYYESGRRRFFELEAMKAELKSDFQN